ncbi:MAG: polynucleotide adenylyltransferase PcnB [Planctomycetota bacterium]
MIRPRDEHCISRKNICDEALKVLYRLQRSGHEAYLVGGGVRDLLLGRTPKDFDVSTEATPQEIKKLFRNCWMIGRRFRLAHIRFGDLVIETSTFRQRPDPEANGNGNGSGNSDGGGDDGDGDEEGEEGDLLVRDDNTFGSAEEDAFRRDFTINGLFYDPSEFTVIDYVGGLEDLEHRLIRTIGEPEVRFQEDPVRMLRAVRFAARLGFTIEEETYAAITAHHGELIKASPPRLLEETGRLFAYGAGAAAIRLAHETGLLQHILPCVSAFLDEAGDDACAKYYAYLEALDATQTDADEVNLPLTFSTLAYPLVLHELGGAEDGSRRFNQVMRPLVNRLAEVLPIPRRLREEMRLILNAQDRFTARRRRRFNKQKFAARSFFPDALALHEFAVAIEDLDRDSLDRWREIFESTSAGRKRNASDGKKEADGADEASADAEDEPDDADDGKEDDAEGKASPNRRSSRRRRGRRGGRRRRKKRDGDTETEEQGDAPSSTVDKDSAATGSDPAVTAETDEKETAPSGAASDGAGDEDDGSDDKSQKRSRRSRRSRRKRSRKKTDDGAGGDETPDASAEGDSPSETETPPTASDEEDTDGEGGGDGGSGKGKRRRNTKRSRRKNQFRDNHGMLGRDDTPVDGKAILSEEEALDTSHWLDEI